MKIFLIGMPGCGKSTYGRKAAEQLGMNFIDLDYEIVKHAGNTINEIFEQQGEACFREIESDLLKKITLGQDEFIMATGGGAPCYFDNMEFMNARGITLYIDTEIDTLLKRLSHKGIDKRPILKKIGRENLEDGLRDKLNKRLPYYSRAVHTIPYKTNLEDHIVAFIRAKTGNLP